MNQQEERWLRFIEHKPNIRLLPDTEYNDLKSFLQSEINLAVEQEKERTINKIKEEWELKIDKDLNTEHSLVPLSQLLNLINNK